MRNFDVVNFDAEAPAGSVFRVYTVRVPRIRNALRVIGALLFGFLVGDPATAPASRRFQVRMKGSNEILDDFGWSEGLALNQDLSELTAGEFAERWLSQEDDAVLEEG